MAKVQLVVTDVDGVHTDDTVLLGMVNGERIELYRFITCDGIVIRECLRHNIPVVFISGRKAPAVKQRAEDLGARCLQGIVDKVEAVSEIINELGLGWNQVLFIGNDIQDISLIRQVGFSAAPRDAAPEARSEADYVTEKKGGEGVVREVLQMMLEVKGMWDPILARERTLG
ncbi:MAG: HAD hydrolase family protein [bacterium]|nr:HAD hydrolase family protein [bacterium]